MKQLAHGSHVIEAGKGEIDQIDPIFRVPYLLRHPLIFGVFAGIPDVDSGFSTWKRLWRGVRHFHIWPCSCQNRAPRIVNPEKVYAGNLAQGAANSFVKKGVAK